MTLTDFTRDYVPILQLIVLTFGLISLALLWWQIRRTTKWNKLQAHHDFFRDKPSANAEKQMLEVLDRLQIDRYVPLTAEQAEQLFDDTDASFAVKCWLNEFEDLCAAINAGTVDRDYAYALETQRVVRNYRLFEQLILRIRKILDTPGFFIELETVALQWERKQLDQKGERTALVVQLQSQLEAARKASHIGTKY